MTMKHLWCSLVLGLTVAATGSAGAQSAHERFEEAVRTAVAPLGDRTVTGIKVLYLGAEHSPWLDSGFPVEAGDRVTVLLQGRVWLSRHYDISLEAPLQLWRTLVWFCLRCSGLKITTRDGTLSAGICPSCCLLSTGLSPRSPVENAA